MSSGFRVAAVIPVRDGLPDVLDAVASALEQTLGPEQVVLVDDGSRDGTAAAVRARFGDRVTILERSCGSAGAARNAGWRAASAPWIAFLDADDLWFPEKLATASQCLARAPEAAWFFSDGSFRSLEGELRDSWLAAYADLPEPYVGQPLAELFEVNFILTSSVVARRDLLEELGGFQERMTHAEDLDLWIRMSRRSKATASRRPLVCYQHRPGGLTRQVESRLGGDVDLFHRLASDASLTPALRRRARRREALAHFKLAMVSLREGRSTEARRRVCRGWMFPERAGQVLLLWLASFLPRPLLEWVRGRGWAKRELAAPMARVRRVALQGAPGGSGRRP